MSGDYIFIFVDRTTKTRFAVKCAKSTITKYTKQWKNIFYHLMLVQQALGQ